MKKILIAILLSCTCFLCSCFASTFSSGQDGESSASIEQSESSSQLVEDEQDSSSVQTEDNSSSSLAENSSSTVDTQTLLLTAHFDYGLHVDNRATLLLGGCSLFFDLESYGIDRINAGDVVEIVYRGELYVLETYPSTVDTSQMEIVDIKITKARTMAFSVMETEDDVSLIYAFNSLTSVQDSFVTFAPAENLYVVNYDGTFAPLGKEHVGQRLYGTVKKVGEDYEIIALYSYAPYAQEEHTCAPVCVVLRETTCQQTGIEQIVCTYCAALFQEVEIPCADCTPEPGSTVCRWCGGEMERESAILLPCCICGSYTCNGHD